MSWRDQLERVDFGGRRLIGGSFRGAPFFVDASDLAGGRRAVMHEFPLRDSPFGEDLGRRARKVKIEGYVIGDDYLDRRDALLAALEDVEGPGELVDPYWGRLRAICESVQVTQSRTEGGFAKFSMDFVETPDQPPTPAIEVDDTDDVGLAADAAVVAARASLVATFSAAGMPTFALDSAEAAIAGAAGAVEAKLAPMVERAQEGAELASRIELLTANAAALATAPAGAFDSLVEAVAGVTDALSAAPGALVDALVDAYSVDLGAAPAPTTDTRAREAANLAAIAGAFRRVFAVAAARVAVTVAYPSIEDATAARDRVVAILTEQAGAADDTAYPAIVALRARLQRALPGARLYARVLTIRRVVSVPSIVLAHQLYGSVALEPDIIARNGVAHPGFVVGDSLKVLSSG